MAIIAETMTIVAPRERVFAYRLDVTNLPEYNPEVIGLEPLDGGPAREGSRYRFQVRVQPWLRVPTTLTIRQIDAPRRLVFEMDSIMTAREVCTFDEVDGGTRLHFETTVHTPGGPLARVLDALFVVPSARRQMVGELAKMKKRLEAGAR